MKITIFICGMLVATAIVAALSITSGANFGVTALRVIGTLVISQALYFAAVLLMVRGEGARKAEGKPTLPVAKGSPSVLYAKKGPSHPSG